MPAPTITPELKRDLQLLKVPFSMLMDFVVLWKFSYHDVVCFLQTGISYDLMDGYLLVMLPFYLC